MKHKSNFDPEKFCYNGGRPFSHEDTPTLTDTFYESEDDYQAQLNELTARMDQAQNRMHAHEKYGLLLIFQAMDAAGKDSSIRHIFKGVNPSRFRIAAFKKPQKDDLKHDFLWRYWQELPERGHIGVFNRSYYEEVITTSVHPERLSEQLIPDEFSHNPNQLWQERCRDIVHFEDYLHRSGFPVLKFYLHVSRKEQGQRLINRLSDTEKHWKLSESDLEERQYWDEYMRAYETAINATATRRNPWYVIPSDNRHNQQLIIGRIVTHFLESLPTEFPTKDEEELRKLIGIIQEQDASVV